MNSPKTRIILCKKAEKVGPISFPPSLTVTSGQVNLSHTPQSWCEPQESRYADLEGRLVALEFSLRELRKYARSLEDAQAKSSGVLMFLIFATLLAALLLRVT